MMKLYGKPEVKILVFTEDCIRTSGEVQAEENPWAKDPYAPITNPVGSEL